MGSNGSIELPLEKMKPERAQGIFVFGSFASSNMDKNSLLSTFDSAGSVSSLGTASVNLILVEHNAKSLKKWAKLYWLAFPLYYAKTFMNFFIFFQILICIIYWVQNSSVKQSGIHITPHVYQLFMMSIS